MGITCRVGVCSWFSASHSRYGHLDYVTMIKRITITPEGRGYRARLLCEFKGEDFLFNAYSLSIDECLSKVVYSYTDQSWKSCCTVEG